MCLTSNQKVGEWIATHLQQMDGLQIRHFVPHPAIKWASPNLQPTDSPDRTPNIPRKCRESDGKVLGTQGAENFRLISASTIP